MQRSAGNANTLDTMKITRPARFKQPNNEKIVFWSVALLLLVQFAYWVPYQYRASRRLLEAQVNELRAGRDRALAMDISYIFGDPENPEPAGSRNQVLIRAREPRIGALQERRERIERAFPYVAVVPVRVDHDDPPLFMESSSMYLTLRRDVLENLEREHRKALWPILVQALAMSGLAGMMVYVHRRLNMSLDLMMRQRNFIASVTHELKTPIASLRVWIETLFSRELGADRLARIHQLMEGDLTRLTTLVGNLLDVARADAGRLDVLPEPTELGPWLQEVCEGMDARLGSGGLGLKVQAKPDVWGNIDPRLFAAVIENLLSNAYKYSEPPRSTTVTLDVDGAQVVIAVSDQGRGFHAREVGKLFQRFYRVEDEMVRQVSGTGLGLFLCREIVGRHHGTIRAASLGEGLGATFTVRIPRWVR